MKSHLEALLDIRNNFIDEPLKAFKLHESLSSHTSISFFGGKIVNKWENKNN